MAFLKVLHPQAAPALFGLSVDASGLVKVFSPVVVRLLRGRSSATASMTVLS
jgi:hypothetical protein